MFSPSHPESSVATQLPASSTGTRQLRSLWAASALGGAGQSLGGSTAALLVGRIGGGDVAAGLPQTLLVVGAAASALILSRRAVVWGRGPALRAGALTAAAGAALVLLTAVLSWLPGVLLGSMFMGAGTTAVTLARYAAAELAAESARARAMGTVLVATTVGAVAGPNLLAPTNAAGTALGLPQLAGPYVFAALGFAAAAAVLSAGLRDAAPLPLTGVLPASVRWTRPAAAGLAVLGLANLVMVGVMTMAPVQLHRMGTGLTVIGLMISVHIAGMFVPSPVSGWLTDRFGPALTAAAAGATLCTACLWAVTAGSDGSMTAAMLLVGIGWNLGLLSGSALLTADVAPELRPAREGWGEAGMGLAASGGGFASGMLMAQSGYSMVAGVGAVVSAVVLPAAWLSWRSLWARA